MAKVARLNFSDIPELLPGARPGAHGSQLEQFEELSRRLHQDEVEERMQERAVAHRAAGLEATCKELEEMFPTLEPALIQTLRADAPSAQHAIETLLVLAASAAEPVGSAAAGGAEGAALVAELPKRDIGMQDHSKFPSLIDADGWQVPPARLEREDEELGSIWRDRAKAAADRPAPKRANRPPVVCGPKMKQGCQKEEDAETGEQAYGLTDYESRHRAGQRRAQQKVQYGRGGRSGGAMGCGSEGALEAKSPAESEGKEG